VNLVLALAVATVPLAAQAGALSVWHLWLVAGMYGLLKMANLAGVPALVPTLVDDDDLNVANAMESISYWVSDAGGPAVAGLLIGLLGGPNVLLFDVVSYALFAALLTQVRPQVPQQADMTASISNDIGLKPAFKFVWFCRPILALTLMFMAFNVAEGMLFVLLPVHAKTVLGGSAATYGWLLSSLALAALATSALVGSIDWRWGLGRSIAATQTLAGFAVLALVTRPPLVLSITALVALGVLTAPLTIWAQTVRMRLIPPELRGRVFGTLRTAMQSTPPLGAAMAGFFLTQEGGWAPAVVFLCACMTVPGIVGLLVPALSQRAVSPNASPPLETLASQDSVSRAVP
jgi:hypothetical protein